MSGLGGSRTADFSSAWPDTPQETSASRFRPPRDALGRRRGGGLKNKRQKQRGLAHHRELRCRELAIVDRKIVRPDMGLEIGGEAVDGFLQHAFVKAAPDIRHPLGNRHHGADRRSAARPALHLDIGLAEFPQRGRDVALRVEIECRSGPVRALPPRRWLRTTGSCRRSRRRACLWKRRRNARSRSCWRRQSRDP